MTQNTSHAVMAQRREPPDSLDFFPTPLWSTRSLFEHVLPAAGVGHICSAWEPACGEGHMATVIEEYVAIVKATDIFDYGSDATYNQPTVADFLDPATCVRPRVDLIATNPPFRLGLEFALKAIEEANEAAALLVRTSWLEGGERYERLFKPHPPAIVAQFAERVPMVKGRWDPGASTATSYAWVVWLNREHPPATRFMWIPPGQRKALTLPDDARRFGARSAAPLLDGASA